MKKYRLILKQNMPEPKPLILKKKLIVILSSLYKFITLFLEGNKKIVTATSTMCIFARTLWDKGIQVHGAFWISDGSHYPKSNFSGM